MGSSENILGAAHRGFQRWVWAGVFWRMWQAEHSEYDELKGLAWKWQAADGALTKAPLSGERTGKNPTDRGKLGTKRGLLVDEQGVPLGLVVSGANTTDGRLLEATLRTVSIEQPDPATPEQHLCREAREPISFRDHRRRSEDSVRLSRLTPIWRNS